MTTKRLWAAIAGFSLLIAVVLAGAPAAQATPPTCAVGPSSIHAQSVSSTRCLGVAFDPTPSQSTDSTLSSIAMSADGTRVVWAHTAEDFSCTGDQRFLELEFGTVSGTSVDWSNGPFDYAGCATYGTNPGIQLAMSANGQHIALISSTSDGSGVSTIHYSTFQWNTNGNFVQLGDVPADTVDGNSSTLDSIQASMSRDGNSVLFSYGANSQSDLTVAGTFMREYSFTTNTLGDSHNFPGVSGTAGLSADGKTIWFAAWLNSGSSPGEIIVEACSAPDFICPPSPLTVTNDLSPYLGESGGSLWVPKITAKVNDSGTEMLLTWSDFINGMPPFQHVTQIPLKWKDWNSDRSANVHEIQWNSNENQVSAYLNPSGTKAWVGWYTNAYMAVEAATTVSGFNATWSDELAWDAEHLTTLGQGTIAVSRSGRLITLAADGAAGSPVIAVSQSNSSQSHWNIQVLGSTAGNSAYDTNSIALSDDGSTYAVVEFTAAGGGVGSHPIVFVNHLAPFNNFAHAGKVTGTYQTGHVLRPNAYTWAHHGGTDTYQWLRNGSVIAGATHRTYTLRSADVGHVVTLVITHTQTGYLQTIMTVGQSITVRSSHGRVVTG